MRTIELLGTLAEGSIWKKLINTWATTPNNGYTATLRSAQMLGFASHFVCPRPLAAIKVRAKLSILAFYFELRSPLELRIVIFERSYYSLLM